jgi:hypothetical protein
MKFAKRSEEMSPEQARLLDDLIGYRYRGD